jgi:hypothetical protein
MVSEEELTSPLMLHGLLPYKKQLALLLAPTPAGQLARETTKAFLAREFDVDGIGQDSASHASGGQAEAAVRLAIEIIDNPGKHGAGSAAVLRELLQVLSARDVARLFDEITPPIQTRRVTHSQRLRECEELIRELATKHNERVEKAREREAKRLELARKE